MGVFRDYKWRRASGRIDPIPEEKIVTVPLLHPAMRPNFKGCIDIEFVRGVRKNHRTDVASLHYQVVQKEKFSEMAHQKIPDLRYRRHM